MRRQSNHCTAVPPSVVDKYADKVQDLSTDYLVVLHQSFLWSVVNKSWCKFPCSKVHIIWACVEAHLNKTSQVWAAWKWGLCLLQTGPWLRCKSKTNKKVKVETPRIHKWGVAPLFLSCSGVTTTEECGFPLSVLSNRQLVALTVWHCLEGLVCVTKASVKADQTKWNATLVRPLMFKADFLWIDYIINPINKLKTF